MDNMNIWQRAVDELLIANHLGTTDKAKTVEEAKEQLMELIKFEIQLATDPAVNGGYKLTKET